MMMLSNMTSVQSSASLTTLTTRAPPATRTRRVSCPNVTITVTETRDQSNDTVSRKLPRTDSNPEPSVPNNGECNAVIASLNTKISTLERTIEELESEYNTMESKCNVYAIENEILLRESLAKSADKCACAEYTKLREQHEEVKATLVSAMTTSKLLLDQNREFEAQRDALTAKCQRIEKENIAYQLEVETLRQIEQSLNNNLISLNHAMNDSKRELGRLAEEHGKAEENTQVIHAFKDEITKLHEKIEDLNDANHALKQCNHENAEKYSLDELEPLQLDAVMTIPPCPSRKSSIGALPTNFYQLFRTKSTSSLMSLMSATSAYDEYNMMEHVVCEVSDSLLQEISDSMGKMESLFASDPVGSEEEKSGEFPVDEDMDQLPRRLEEIYNKVNAMMKDLSTQVREAEALNKKLENRIQTKDNEIEMLQTDAEGYKVQIAEIMQLQNESDRGIFVSLQKQIASLKEEIAHYRIDIVALSNIQIDYDYVKRDATDLRKEIENKALIQNELESMRREYELLQREHMKQYMRTELDRETNQNIVAKQQQYIKELTMKHAFIVEEMKERYETKIAKLVNTVPRSGTKWRERFASNAVVSPLSCCFYIASLALKEHTIPCIECPPLNWC